MKRDKDKKYTFRRIGGRIIPIAIGANLVRVGRSQLKTTSENITSVAKDNFFSPGRTIKTKLKNRHIATTKIRTKNFFGKKATFVDSFFGAGRAVKAAIHNESVLAKTKEVMGFPVTSKGIEFSSKHGGKLFTFGSSKNKKSVLYKNVSERGAKSALNQFLSKKSKRGLAVSFKRFDDKFLGTVKRGNKKMIALGLTAMAYGAFKDDK